MTDEVAALVLRDSYTQTQALGVTVSQAPALLDVHARMIRSLEQAGVLDRALEFLPSDDEIAERRLHDRGLTSPELAVLLAYTKISLHARLIESSLPDDADLADELLRYFPAPLSERFADELRGHRLRREIIATHLTNDFVDHAGISAAFAWARRPAHGGRPRTRLRDRARCLRDAEVLGRGRGARRPRRRADADGDAARGAQAARTGGALARALLPQPDRRRRDDRSVQRRCGCAHRRAPGSPRERRA